MQITSYFEGKHGDDHAEHFITVNADKIKVVRYPYLAGESVAVDYTLNEGVCKESLVGLDPKKI